MKSFPVFQPVFWRLFVALSMVFFPIVALVGYLTVGARISLIVEQSMRFGLGGKIGMLGLLLLGMMLAVIAFSTLTLTHRIVFHIRDTGLAAPTLTGRLSFTLWEDVTEAKVLRLPFVPFLRVRAEKATIYAPLFVAHKQQLHEAIEELVPNDNPVKKAL